MKIASCMLILTFSNYLSFVELSIGSDRAQRPRSSSPPRIQPAASTQSSQIADQSAMSALEAKGSHSEIVRQDPLDPFYIPGGTGAIYLQMPGNHVVRGVLNLEWYTSGVPIWMKMNPGHKKVETSDRVFLYVPKWNALYLKADIRTTVQTEGEPNVHGYKCFIKTAHGLYKANLSPNSAEEEVNLRRISKTTVYVLIPGHNLIYSGEVEPFPKHIAPRWIKL